MQDVVRMKDVAVVRLSLNQKTLGVDASPRRLKIQLQLQLQTICLHFSLS